MNTKFVDLKTNHSLPKNKPQALGSKFDFKAKTINEVDQFFN